MKLREEVDPASMVVIAITFVLFFAALFTKGLTHDMLLEGGVFLVSVKLILMSHKSSVATKNLEKRLDEIHGAIERRESG